MQNAQIQIILRMCKVSSWPLLSTETFFNIQWFCLWATKTLIRLHGCAGCSGPWLSAYAQRHIFAWHIPYVSHNICTFSVRIFAQGNPPNFSMHMQITWVTFIVASVHTETTKPRSACAVWAELRSWFICITIKLLTGSQGQLVCQAVHSSSDISISPSQLNINLMAYYQCLTILTLWAKSAEEKPKNRLGHFMQIVSTGDNLHGMSKPIWHSKCCLLQFLSSMLSI